MKSEAEWCILTTNEVIDRWKSSISRPAITTDDVYQVFLGYLRKRLISARKNQEFKEIKKRVILTVDNNHHISYVSIITKDIGTYSYKSIAEQKALTLEKIFDEIDYNALKKGLVTKEIDSKFQSIKNIKF